MQSLNMERTYRVLLGEVNRFRIMLVGAGGTGSSLALALAGLAYHARQKGIRVALTLVDHDKIQAGNVGRQQFGVAGALSGDVPKVVDLALRLNAAYGLDIAAWPQKYSADMARGWFHHGAGGRDCAHLVIGCVDHHSGRREIAKTVAAYHGRVWALDSGNDRWSGQVLIGNVTDVSQIQFDHLGLCTGLPSPYLQEPDLLAPETTEQPQSCAEMTLIGEQSLMVNKMAAAIAAHYCFNFILRRQVVQMASYFNLEPTVMTAVPITRKKIEAIQEKL